MSADWKGDLGEVQRDVGGSEVRSYPFRKMAKL